MNTHSFLNAAPTAALRVSAGRQPVAVTTLGAEVETRAGTEIDNPAAKHLAAHNPAANNLANVVTKPFAGADASAGTQCIKEYATGECITGSLVMIQ